jgi:hypothetical protein
MKPSSLRQVRPVLEAIYQHYEVPRDLRLEVLKLLEELPLQATMEALARDLTGPVGQGEHV